MQTKIKKINPYLKGNLHIAVKKYSLFIILMGVFSLPKIGLFSSLTEERIIELTNNERTQNNIAPLTANQLLTKAAYDKGLYIIKSQTFQHNIDGIKFSTWIKDTGYKYSYVGENLALDFITSEGTLKAWMESPTHKKNILNNVFTEIGVAIIEDEFEGEKTNLIVQVFGTPMNTTLASNEKTPQTIGASEELTTNNNPVVKNQDNPDLILSTNLKYIYYSLLLLLGAVVLIIFKRLSHYKINH